MNKIPCKYCLVKPICKLRINRGDLEFTDGKIQLYRAILDCILLEEYYSIRYSDIYPNDIIVTKKDRIVFLKCLGYDKHDMEKEYYKEN